MAMVEFGVVFGRWQTLSNAAREGARLAVVFRAPCDGPTVEAEVRQTVKDYASNLGIVLNDTDITVTGECDATVASQTTVQVNFDHPFRVLPGFAEGLNPTLALVGTSVMRNEGSG
jgi:Flp pilus assembly protein TadG